jgi:NAD(P)H dehydrogenase (quinone)
VFVVLGASGNTGKVVAETLLSQKRKVRVVVRDAAKGRAWKEAGAEVSIADVEDGAALQRAFRGAEGAYVLLPPNFSSTQVRVDNNRRASTIAAAVEAAGVAHVVMLSAIGAQEPHGTGSVLPLRDAEATFTRGLAAATFVRAAYFMENWGSALFAVAQGVLPTFLLAEKAIPLVATRDVGTAAARLLAEGGSGKRVIELAGPREYSPRDVAAALARVVGKPIAVQEAPEEAMAPALMGAGMNAEWARLFQELIHGLNAGIVAWEGGHPLWRGETDVEAVLSTLIGETRR